MNILGLITVTIFFIALFIAVCIGQVEKSIDKHNRRVK